MFPLGIVFNDRKYTPPESLVERVKDYSARKVEDVLVGVLFGLENLPEGVFRPFQAVYSLYDRIRNP